MDILEVADAFLYLDSMSPKKLQKLCYYAQGWYAGLTGRRLFTNELEAWIHGPVSPKLYEKYKMYGYENIPQKDVNTEDIELRGIAEQIYRIYGKLDGDELEQLITLVKSMKRFRKLGSIKRKNKVCRFSRIFF